MRRTTDPATSEAVVAARAGDDTAEPDVHSRRTWSGAEEDDDTGRRGDSDESGVDY